MAIDQREIQGFENRLERAKKMMARMPLELGLCTESTRQCRLELDRLLKTASRMGMISEVCAITGMFIQLTELTLKICQTGAKRGVRGMMVDLPSEHAPWNDTPLATNGTPIPETTQDPEQNEGIRGAS